MKIACMFPGFQSQFVGMGKELYDEYRIVQEQFEQASSCLDINFVKLCFASSDAELAQTAHAYTSTFLIGASIAELLKEKAIPFDVVTGFNHGVYAALYAAQGINLPDGLYLLKKFASFYDTAIADMDVTAIHITGVTQKEITDICLKSSTGDQKVFVSIYETPTQQIVAGHTHAVERVRDLVSALSDKKEVSIDYVDLAVGLHSELIDPVIDTFKAYLNKVDFHDLVVPMIESLHGTLLKRGDDVREQILARINSPIVWPRVMKQLAQYDLILEIGPGTTLSKWLTDLYPDTHVMAINTPDDIEKVAALVQPNTDASSEQNLD